MVLAVLTLIVLVISCGPPIKSMRYGDLSAPCPKTAYMKLKFCSGFYAYSDRIQHLSRVRITDPKTRKSLILPVRFNRRIKGICIPKKFKRIFGKENIFAKVEVLRCGDNGIRRCPKRIKGLASWYGPKFHGRKTAAGNRFNMHSYTAAHRTLPIGTILLVKNLKNGKSVKVKVLDRGPYIRGRELDLSYGAAKKLEMLKEGVIPFVAEVIRCGG